MISHTGRQRPDGIDAFFVSFDSSKITGVRNETLNIAIWDIVVQTLTTFFGFLNTLLSRLDKKMPLTFFRWQVCDR